MIHIAAMRVLKQPEPTATVEGRPDGTPFLSAGLLAAGSGRRALERRSSDMAQLHAETIEPEVIGAGGTG